MVHVDDRRQQRTRMATRITRFRSCYGLGPGGCHAIFQDLRTTNIENARIARPNIFYFLVAMNWLASYREEAEMACIFETDEKTLRNHIKKYVDAIGNLYRDKIKLPDLSQQHEIFILSVDGVHFRINEPRRRPNAAWCSYKFNQAGLSYEIGLSIYDSHVVWISGPYRASTHDLTIYQQPQGLKSKIPPGKRVIADRGYAGEDTAGSFTTLAIRNEFDSAQVRAFKRRVRGRHESFNARLKNYKILSERFRHGVDRHASVFHAVCVCCIYDMEDDHPLFDV